MAKISPIAAVVFLLAVAAGCVLLSVRHPSVEDNVSTGGNGPTNTSHSGSAATSALARTIHPNAGISERSLNLDRSVNLEDFVRDHLDEAAKGDAEAERLIAYAYEECKQLGRSPETYAKTLESAMGEQLSSDQMLRFESAVRREIARCGTLSADGAKAALWFNGAASNGDVAANVRLSASSVDTANIASSFRAAAATGDGNAIAEIGNSLTYLSDAERASLGGLFDDRLAAQAWSLAACDFGANCSADGGQLRNICIRAARCDFNTLYDAYASLLSPIDYQQVLKLERAIRIAIQNNDF